MAVTILPRVSFLPTCTLEVMEASSQNASQLFIRCITCSLSDVLIMNIGYGIYNGMGPAGAGNEDDYIIHQAVYGRGLGVGVIANAAAAHAVAVQAGAVAHAAARAAAQAAAHAAAHAAAPGANVARHAAAVAHASVATQAATNAAVAHVGAAEHYIAAHAAHSAAANAASAHPAVAQQVDAPVAGPHRRQRRNRRLHMWQRLRHARRDA